MKKLSQFITILVLVMLIAISSVAVALDPIQDETGVAQNETEDETDATEDEADEIFEVFNITFVNGHVYDAAGEIGGAEIMIKCQDDSTRAVSGRYLTSTDPDGYYTLYIMCPTDSAVTVTATYGGAEETSSGDIEHIGDVYGKESNVIVHVGVALDVDIVIS